MMKFLKKLFFKIIHWIRSLFFRSKVVKEKSFSPDVIGTAVFDAQHYLFVRKKRGVFLVSDTKNHHYHQKIHFPGLLDDHIETMSHLDAITLDSGEHVVVCTLEHDGLKQVVYLGSEDTTHFMIKQVFENPDGMPHKIVVNDRNEVFAIAPIGGKIHYRKIGQGNFDEDYHETALGPRDNSFDHGPLNIVGVNAIPDGIFVIYEVSYEFPGYQAHYFGAALLAHDNLSHIHWRAFHDEVPFWENFISRSESDINLRSVGAYFKGDDIKILFFDEKHQDIYSIDLHQPYNRRDVHPQKAQLKKYVNNPIMKPKDNNWECYSVFNPAAIEIDGITHMLYRAEGSAGLSVVGYAKSYNGVTFDRLADPIYLPRMHFEGVGVSEITLRRGTFKSGYNHYPVEQKFDWHGVEDPRITELEGRLYMIYAAYNGYQMARPAITSIAKEDFVAGIWNWKTPQPMTDVPIHHGDGNKNVVLFPEKVNGKYMLFHRIWPHIRIDYVDSLEFGPNEQYLKDLKQIPARGDSWDSHKIAVAAPPLRIDEGWLLIYQGAGSQDRQYKIGAMILDHDDPSKVLYRSNYPIMTPSQWYEHEHKFGVAYPCGAVIKDDMLNIYYGGSDKYVCLGQADLKEFVKKLKQDPYKESVLQKHKNIKELCI